MSEIKESRIHWKLDSSSWDLGMVSHSTVLRIRSSILPLMSLQGNLVMIQGYNNIETRCRLKIESPTGTWSKWSSWCRHGISLKPLHQHLWLPFKPKGENFEMWKIMTLVTLKIISQSNLQRTLTFFDNVSMVKYQACLYYLDTSFSVISYNWTT